MTRWPNTERVDISLDFGQGALSLGGAALARSRPLFQYDGTFVRNGINPSPILLAFNTDVKPGSPELEGLPGLLHDSLPDGWSRLVLDRFVRSRGYDHTSLNILDRLALVGDTGAGALCYQGRTALPLQPLSVDFDTAAALVTKAPEEMDTDRIEAALTLTRSLGGARPKAYVYLRDGNFTTAGEPGAGSWIVKFPAKDDGLVAGAIEYAYSLMAKAAGIDMPPTVLLPSQESAGFFAVERFDRTGAGGRLHMHSLGGLLNAPAKANALGYVELMQVTGQLTQPSGTDAASIDEQIRRMAFNVYAQNRDDHAKNHSFLMDAGGAWRCAPAFDLTHANLTEHCLLVGSEGRTPQLKDMLDVTRSVRVPDARATRLIDQVRDAVGDWPTFAKEANVDREKAKGIDRELNGPGSSPPTPRFFTQSPSSSRDR